MDRLVVTGGTPLSGSVPIAGAKNSALKLMAAALLAPGRSVIHNVPRIQDCVTMVEVLEHLGATAAWTDGTLLIDATEVTPRETPYELVSRMRASILVLGPLLARFLTGMGASIEGVGTPTIEIEGVDAFEPVEHTVIPDRVEAGTFAIAACATGGSVVLQGARADHMDLVFSKLADAGADISITEDGVAVSLRSRPNEVDLVTLPYPGFPTDLQ